jgi:hypothetical protein
MSNGSVVQPPLPNDAADSTLEGPVVGDNLNMEPIVDDDEEKSFIDKCHGKFSAVERLSICLLRIMGDLGAPFETYGTIMERCLMMQCLTKYTSLLPTPVVKMSSYIFFGLL